MTSRAEIRPVKCKLWLCLPGGYWRFSGCDSVVLIHAFAIAAYMHGIFVFSPGSVVWFRFASDLQSSHSFTTSLMNSIMQEYKC